MGNTLNDDIKCPHCGESIKADVEQKKYKQLYDRYTQCRDAELDRFWKNSVFVWVFLALCFTALGLLASKFADSDVYSFKTFKIQLFISVVCCFGFICSLIWQRMAKGLKAWYEVFEMAIWDIESYTNALNLPKRFTIENYWTVQTGKTSKPFSPSKIVVQIGFFLTLFWGLAFLLNWVLFRANMDIHHWYFHLSNVIILAICLFVYCRGINNIKSSSLRTEEQQFLFEEFRNELLLQKIDYSYFEIKDKTRLVLKEQYFYSNTKIIINFLDYMKIKFENAFKKYPLVIELITDSYTSRDYTNELFNSKKE